MLYYLESLRSVFGPFRLFEYVTFRSGGALLTAMLIVILAGGKVIPLLKKFCIANWRYENLLSEQEGEALKKKTPTMGGVLIVGAILISTVLWGVITSRMLLIFISVLFSLSLLGFADDLIKIRYKRSVRDGVPGKVKFLASFFIAVTAAYLLYKTPDAVTMQIFLPFYKEPVMAQPDLDAAVVHLSVPFCSAPLLTLPLTCMSLFVGVMLIFNGFVVTGACHAVNLTDGKDGLAAGCMIFASLSYAVIAYMCGHSVFAKYLAIPYIPAAGEVCVFAFAVAGACIGFLWYNCNPASVFMGDTGSLPLGGVIGLISVLIGQQLLLIIVGFVFVMEAGSVMLQVWSVRLTGKRIFLCSPIHHHFERLNWAENQIVVRFWIIAGICALLGIATLKLH